VSEPSEPNLVPGESQAFPSPTVFMWQPTRWEVVPEEEHSEWEERMRGLLGEDASLGPTWTRSFSEGWNGEFWDDDDKWPTWPR